MTPSPYLSAFTLDEISKNEEAKGLKTCISFISRFQCLLFLKKQENSPWYAPQNHILLFPWIWCISSEAFDAATDGTEWPVDRLTRVCFGG